MIVYLVLVISIKLKNITTHLFPVIAFQPIFDKSLNLNANTASDFFKVLHYFVTLFWYYIAVKL